MQTSQQREKSLTLLAWHNIIDIVEMPTKWRCLVWRWTGEPEATTTEGLGKDRLGTNFTLDAERLPNIHRMPARPQNHGRSPDGGIVEIHPIRNLEAGADFFNADGFLKGQIKRDALFRHERFIQDE